MNAVHYMIASAFLATGAAIASQDISPAHVYRLEAGSTGDQLVWSLRQGLVVLDQVPDEPLALANAYNEALGRENVQVGHGANLVSVGPVLDSGDEVRCGALSRVGDHVTVQVSYTHERDVGRELRKNIVWRPIVRYAMPSEWGTGSYTIELLWLQISEVGKPMKPPISYKVSFTVNK